MGAKNISMSDDKDKKDVFHIQNYFKTRKFYLMAHFAHPLRF